MKYRFIDRYSSEFRVEKMCKVLGVSRSGYYGWRKRPQSRRQRENEQVLMDIQESYKRSKEIYGSPRITEDLHAKGIRCGKNRVARIMRNNGMVARSRRKFKATTNSKHTLPVAENLLEQNFHTDRPNKVWASDITYIPTLEGWLYVAVIIDVFSRQVVGWAMSERMTADFVIRALANAIRGRRPSAGLIFHSDRGVQYACSAFKDVLSQYGDSGRA
jgi:transposase InsO family protein